MYSAIDTNKQAFHFTASVDIKREYTYLTQCLYNDTLPPYKPYAKWPHMIFYLGDSYNFEYCYNDDRDFEDWQRGKQARYRS